MITLFEYIGISLVGGLGLIFVSKIIMAKILQRKEDYYNKDGGEDNE